MGRRARSGGLCVGVVWLALGASAASASWTRCPAEGGEVDVEACLEGAPRVAAETVRAHFQRRARLEAVASLWVEGAAGVTRGRFARAEPRDVTLEPAQIDAVTAHVRRTDAQRAEEVRVAPPEVAFEELRARIDGERARVRAVVLIRVAHGELTEAAAVDARLRRDGEAWKLERLRVRGLYLESPDERVRYDRAWWAARDREVAQARRAHRRDPADVEAYRAWARALHYAHRLDEALREATALAERDDATDADRAYRDQLALALGRVPVSAEVP